ncbi:MAG: hypothetical protein MR550_06495 [Bacilli bacterium]|nr:hypothetical protein [Bacilli bacterium]
MKYETNDIITLTDNREFKVIKELNIGDIEFLYLKNNKIDEYTIVKVIQDKIYNLTNGELSKVLASMLLRSYY